MITLRTAEKLFNKYQTTLQEYLTQPSWNGTGYLINGKFIDLEHLRTWLGV